MTTQPTYVLPVELIADIKKGLINLGYAHEGTPNNFIQDCYFKYVMVRQTGMNPNVPYALDLLPSEIRDQLTGIGGPTVSSIANLTGFISPAFKFTGVDIVEGDSVFITLFSTNADTFTTPSYSTSMEDAIANSSLYGTEFIGNFGTQAIAGEISLTAEQVQAVYIHLQALAIENYIHFFLFHLVDSSGNIKATNFIDAQEMFNTANRTDVLDLELLGDTGAKYLRADISSIGLSGSEYAIDVGFRRSEPFSATSTTLPNVSGDIYQSAPTDMFGDTLLNGRLWVSVYKDATISYVALMA